MLLKFVHAADLHIDSPFVGLSKVDDEIAESLRKATFCAFDNIVELCLREEVDFLLVAGDVYDGEDLSLPAQLRFRRGLERLSEAGIKSYIVHGNHDPLKGRRKGLKWPASAHFFGGKVGSEVFERDGEAKAIIHGISFVKSKTEENLARRFERMDSPLFQIGLLHCSVGSHSEHELYAACGMSDLTAAGLDYWALGHIHKMEVLSAHRPRIAYSGNTQGRHINESGPRGCFLVSVDDGGEIESEFCPTDVVRWGKQSLSIEGIEDEDGLLSGFQDSLSAVQKASDGRPAICRLIVSGRGPMHQELQRPGQLEQYLDEVRHMGLALSPFVWPESIRLKTSPEIDIEQRMKAEDVVGDCLRILRDLGAEDGKTKATEWLSDAVDHAGVSKYLEALSDEDVDEVVNTAQSLLLDELVGDEP